MNWLKVIGVNLVLLGYGFFLIVNLFHGGPVVEMAKTYKKIRHIKEYSYRLEKKINYYQYLVNNLKVKDGETTALVFFLKFSFLTAGYESLN
jgi:hypothetical protein